MTDTYETKRSKMPEKLSAKDKTRFLSFLNKDGECWLWTGSKRRRGYGQFHIGKKGYMAHRLSYYMATHRDPGDLQICHKCDNPSCVRPSHLFAGNQSENLKDCVAKGRHHLASKTHCHRGHKFEENLRGLRRDKSTYRICKLCVRIDTRAKQRANPALMKVYRIRCEKKLRSTISPLLDRGLSAEEISKKTGYSRLMVERAMRGIRYVR